MTIKILMLLGKVGEHCFLSAGSLMKRVGATMISSDHNQLRHHHSVVSLKLIFLSSRKSNQGSKKNKNHQNFTANPLSSFPNSWIECKCLKKGKTCRRYLRRNTQKLKTVLFCKSRLSLGTEIEQTIDRS